MDNKQKFIKISEAIRSSDLKKTGKFKVLVNGLDKTSTLDLAENIIELCLEYNINCQELIDKYSEYKESKLFEKDFRKILYMVLV